MDFNHACLAVTTFNSALKQDEIYYPQVFSEECKYIEKTLVRHINDNLSDFSYSLESNEEENKTIRLIIFEKKKLNFFFKRAILKEFNE